MSQTKITKFCRTCKIDIQCMRIGKFIRCLRCGNIVQIINGECRTDSLGRVSSTPVIPEIKTALEVEQELKK